MKKKEYIQPVTKMFMVHSEGIMYSTSIEQGEDWSDEELLDETARPAYFSKQENDTFWDELLSDF